VRTCEAMSTEKNICIKCGKPKREQLLGSFTQWIFDQNSCACETAASVNAARTAAVANQFCTTCGRPTTQGREGSMTQWIFRSVPCVCSRDTADQAPLQVPVDTAIDSDEGQSEGLFVDAKHFPTERYKPLAELGAGATGKIYLCNDRLLRKRVAVKTLRMLTKEQFMAFQTEARATSRLKHPAILNLLDFGPTESGAPYMVLEYFDSQSLSDFIAARGLLDQVSLQQIFMQVLSALDLAHGMGIYHRDLKPENILISSSGNKELEVKLIDFGTAMFTAFSEEGQEIQSLTMVGTPAYMAPDCASGRPFDARSEIYSLGCVMFECMTGTPPFEGSTAVELLSQHAHVPAPNLREFEIEVCDEIANLVERCLEKDPKDRFQSIKQLRETLSRIDTQSKQPVQEIELFEKTPDPTTDKPESKVGKMVWLVALAALLLLAFPLGVLWTQNRPQEPTGPAMPLTPQKEGVYKCLAPEFPEEFDDTQLKLLVIKKNFRLSLDNTKVTTEGLRYIIDQPIECLTLRETSIDMNTAIPVLSKMRSLKNLGITNSTLTNENLPALKGLSLDSLDLSKNPQINAESLAIVAKTFPNLKTLYLVGTSVSCDGIPYLYSLKKLKGLDLSNMPIDDTCIERVLPLPLFGLEINMTDVTDKGFIALSKMKTLKSIKVLGTVHVTQKGVDELKKSRPDIRVVIDAPNDRFLRLRTRSEPSPEDDF